MGDILRGEQCTENLAGLGTIVYVGLKSDLESPMTPTDNVYSTPVFKSGKGLFRIDGKRESQKVAWSSLGFQKGYQLTATIISEATGIEAAKIDRAMNCLDLFLIFVDEDQSLILYDPNRPLEADNGGISGDTGDTADSDRQTTYEFQLKPVKYTRLYVEAPANGGWESLRVNQ